ncbi:hypothetical protein ACB094_11G110600 [Castanea mollissima]
MSHIQTFTHLGVCVHIHNKSSLVHRWHRYNPQSLSTILSTNPTLFIIALDIQYQLQIISAFGPFNQAKIIIKCKFPKRARAWASLDRTKRPLLSLRFSTKLASFFLFATRSKSLSTSIFAKKQRLDPKPTSSNRFWYRIWWSWEFWVLVLRFMPIRS